MIEKIGTFLAAHSGISGLNNYYLPFSACQLQSDDEESSEPPDPDWGKDWPNHEENVEDNKADDGQEDEASNREEEPRF